MGNNPHLWDTVYSWSCSCFIRWSLVSRVVAWQNWWGITLVCVADLLSPLPVEKKQNECKCRKRLGGCGVRLTARLIWVALWENRIFAYAKIKAQISFTIIAKLISAFVFAPWIVSKSKISSFYPSYVAVQAALSQTLSETLVFSRWGSFNKAASSLTE